MQLASNPYASLVCGLGQVLLLLQKEVVWKTTIWSSRPALPGVPFLKESWSFCL